MREEKIDKIEVKERLISSVIVIIITGMIAFFIAVSCIKIAGNILYASFMGEYRVFNNEIERENKEVYNKIKVQWDRICCDEEDYSIDLARNLIRKENIYKELSGEIEHKRADIMEEAFICKEIKENKEICIRICKSLYFILQKQEDKGILFTIIRGEPDSNNKGVSKKYSYFMEKTK